jgi:hypothetical protein
MEDEIKRIEAALSDLKRSTPRTPVSGVRDVRVPKEDPFRKIEAAEKIIERIKTSKALEGPALKQFEELSKLAIDEDIRLLGRGDELSATINCTVTGTATISVS